MVLSEQQRSQSSGTHIAKPATLDHLDPIMRGDRVIQSIIHDLEHLYCEELSGEVLAVRGLRIEIGGLTSTLAVGDRCRITTRDKRAVRVEVVGFQGNVAVAMPFDGTEGIGPGAKATVLNSMAAVRPHESWLGRVVDPFGEPIDNKGMLPLGERRIRLRANPPTAHHRDRVGAKMDTGVKAINAFLTLCRGQRMGIFAGSGVGKSMLLSQIAKFCSADVVVIGLVGERGREVREFIEDYLGAEGLRRSVVVVASSDQAALLRRDAAYTTAAIAEYFRDKGKHVLCLVDSVTRFAMAQREIGLSAGEPPAAKGYTPSVFAELPKVLERCGPGVNGVGSITALFTVLVEGDDLNEPISDAVRGILDGHIVLSRSIANRGRFPSIDILQSVSRMIPSCNNDQENFLINRARSILSLYSDMEELIRLGAYRPGADTKIDEAIRLFSGIDGFIAQLPTETVSLADSYNKLAQALGEPETRLTSGIAKGAPTPKAISGANTATNSKLSPISTTTQGVPGQSGLGQGVLGQGTQTAPPTAGTPLSTVGGTHATAQPRRTTLARNTLPGGL